MMPTRRFLAVALCVLAAAGPASANIAPPGWAFARHRCVLDPGRFAAGATGGGYRFFVTAVRLQPVEPGGRFNLGTRLPARLIAVPSAHADAWLGIVAAHDDPRDPAIYETARETIPGLALCRLPPRRTLRTSSSPLRTIEVVFRVESIEGGTIRYTTSERQQDVDGRPIGRAVLTLLGIAVLGLTGLVLTTLSRRRRKEDETS